MKTRNSFRFLLMALVLVLGALPIATHAAVSQWNDQNFNQNVSQGVVVVDFYADWCGPCKKLAPTFSKVSNEMTSVRFGKVNIDQASQTAKQYNISSIPALIIFKDGKEVRRNVGAVDEASLKNMIRSVN